MNCQTPITIEQLCSDPIIDAAYAQLCKQWHLRKAVKKMNRVLETLCVSKAEKKTFIGALCFRVRDKGYDWLGYRIAPVTVKTPTGTSDTPNQHAPSNTTTPNHSSHDTVKSPATDQGQNHPAQRATRHYQLTMNKTCITNHSFHKNKELFNRLYEQGASPEALATYVKRWCFLFREQGQRAVSYWTGEWKRLGMGLKGFSEMICGVKIVVKRAMTRTEKNKSKKLRYQTIVAPNEKSHNKKHEDQQRWNKSQ